MEAAPLGPRSTHQQSGYKIITHKGVNLPDTYWPMVFSSWLRVIKHSDQFFRLIDPKAFYPVYQKLIIQITSRPTVEFKLAVLCDDFDVCIGYSVIETPGVLHFVYVEEMMRSQGLSKYLLPVGFKTVTHLTKLGEYRILKKHLDVKFNPFYPEPTDDYQPRFRGNPHKNMRSLW